VRGQDRIAAGEAQDRCQEVRITRAVDAGGVLQEDGKAGRE
jgi:hypothetical protein